MKAKFGSFIVDGRGKIGGHVASRNRAGAYLRTKVTPTNPQSTAQSSARALFGTISQQWSGLSEDVRSAWSAAVSSWTTTDVFGDSITPTGKNLFQRLNNQAQSAGYAAVTTVPEKGEVIENTVTAASFSVATSTLTLTGDYDGIEARTVLSATEPLSQGTTFVKNKLRQIYSDLGADFDYAEAGANYVAKFGTPSVGDNIYISTKMAMPNGQVSTPITLKMEVVA